MSDFGIIYKATSPSGKVYVGQTSSELKIRRNQHSNNCFNKNSDSYNTKFYKALRKYGPDNFIWEILEQVDVKEINEKEIEYIKEYNSNIEGYNTSIGGLGARGFERSKETCLKISNSKKGKCIGKLNPFYGKKHSNETKNKLSQLRKNKGVGQENSYFGKNHTEEIKLKMRKPRENFPWNNNANATIYTIQSPGNDVFIFNGRDLLKNFLSEKNTELGLKNSDKISWISLTKKKPYISQGWKLINREKINYGKI